MQSHVFFLMPEVSGPTGGINVAIDFAEMLRDAGHSVSMHWASADYVYPFYQHSVPTTWEPQPAEAPGLRRRLRGVFSRPRRDGPPRRTRANLRRTPGPDDIVVMPEFCLDKMLPRYPDTNCVILAQSGMGGSHALARLAPRRLSDFANVLGVVAVSDFTADMVRAFTGMAPYKVPLFLSDDRFRFRADKNRKSIAFMARKRPSDRAILEPLLRNDPALAGYEFRAITNARQDEVERVLSESLFFLSFSHREGFGLPPAEAMATGSVVIGYRGVGGNEFFTSDWGIPVPEDEVMVFYQSVVAAVKEYEADPTRLDAMRRSASEGILARYNRERTRQALLQAWSDLDRRRARSQLLA